MTAFSWFILSFTSLLALLGIRYVLAFRHDISLIVDHIVMDRKRAVEVRENQAREIQRLQAQVVALEQLRDGTPSWLPRTYVAEETKVVRSRVPAEPGPTTYERLLREDDG